MTEDEFRRLALRLPEVVESSHMGHADFRVRGKIFATLAYPSDGWAMVKLSQQDQQLVLQASPTVFSRVKGAWGLRGATSVHLRAVTKTSLRDVLHAAWGNVAPKALVRREDARH